MLEDDNYVADVRTSRFLVKPRDITLTLTAGDITYGAQPKFTVSADKSQFAYGEDISVLRQGTVVIKKDGAVVSGNLAAGSYTAETGGYKNANYNVIHGTAQFTVKKGGAHRHGKRAGQLRIRHRGNPRARICGFCV